MHNLKLLEKIQRLFKKKIKDRNVKINFDELFN